MKDLAQTIKYYSNKDLKQRKTWYSPVAEAYNQTLLSTCSPYLELDVKIRNALFEGLQHKIDENFAGRLQLLNLSAFHVARKS